MPRPPRETPIERIFREVVRQKMPLAIKGKFTAQTRCSESKIPTKRSRLARTIPLTRTLAKNHKWPKMISTKYSGNLSRLLRN